MPPIFRLNGIDCLNPAQLISEFNRIGYSTSEFEGLANQFVQQRGADPSYGFFLVPHEAVQNEQQKSLTIFLANKIDRASSKNFTVQIEWHKKIGNPKFQADAGYTLVKVVDERYVLSSELVSKRFNHVLRFNPSNNPDLKGSFTYHPDTVNTTESAGSPYTWESIFREVWRVPSGASLTIGEISFPKYTPQDIDFRYTTRRDALEMLFQWTGTTITLDDKGQWNLVEVGGTANLSNYNNILSEDSHLGFKTPGDVIPGTLKLYFPLEEASSSDVKSYQIIEKSPIGNKNSMEVHLRLPAIYAANFSSPNLPQTIGDEFLQICKRRWDQFPSQEKTFFGFLSLNPSKSVERIIYYQFSGQSFTHVQTVGKRQWMIVPREREGIQVNHAVGRVMQGVLPITPFFTVQVSRIIAGRVVPEDTTVVKVLNEHQQTYQPGDSINVFQEDGDEFWSTTRVGGAGGTELARFELAEDKVTTDFNRLAFLLDDSGNRALREDNSPILVYVQDPWNRFQGYKAYTDPFYGEQLGYRGTCSFLMTTDSDSIFQGRDVYRIIEMEHVARYMETTLPGTATVQGTFDYLGSGIGYASPSFNYWDGRSPKTEKHTFGESTEQITLDVVRFTDRLSLFGRVRGGEGVKLIWDEVTGGQIYTLWAKKPAPGGSGATIIQGRIVEDFGIADATAKILIEASSDIQNFPPGIEIICGNKIDLLNPNNTEATKRYMFLGNKDGYAEAIFFGGVWELSVVQSPTSIPSR